MTEMRAANGELTLAGVIVVVPSDAESSPTPEQKAVLGALHLRKIDLADRVLIVNAGGYVGESTRREIAYAQAAGKPLTFSDPLTTSAHPSETIRRSGMSGRITSKAARGPGGVAHSAPWPRIRWERVFGCTTRC